MWKYFVYSVFFALIFTFGCSDDKIIRSNEGVIMPLEVGYRWEGTQTTYFNDDSTQTQSLDYSISDQSNIDNEIWFAIAEIRDGDTAISNIYHANRSTGLWSRYPEMCSMGGQPRLYAKYPAAVGDRFNVEGETYTEVLSTDETISVPAGEFRCYCYYYHTPDGEGFPIRTSCWAPGVGQIYWRINAVSTGRTFVWQLDDFVKE